MVGAERMELLQLLGDGADREGPALSEPTGALLTCLVSLCGPHGKFELVNPGGWRTQRETSAGQIVLRLRDPIEV